MRSKIQSSINLKFVFVGCSLIIFLLVFVTRSSFSSSPNTTSRTHISNSSDNPNINEEEEDTKPSESTKSACPEIPFDPTCPKMPPSLANTLIHYATTNITPQQTFDEVSVTKRVLDKKSPCNFLVFGLGHDSLMWAALNHGGRTVFLEEDESWIQTIKERLPSLESYHVVYNTKVKESEKLMEIGSSNECKVVTDPRASKCELALKGLPSDVYNIEWDLIMVDAPTGYHEEAPGRMSALYTAGLMARNREDGETNVFVHDVDRAVEDKFSMAFLCKGYMREQQGRLRHFTVPSHRTRAGRPFCPVDFNQSHRV